MLTLFRNFAKSKWAIGLLVLLAIGLLVTGGSQVDLLGALQPPQVIKAGDRSMGQAEFRAELERVRSQQQQQTGQAVTFEQLIADGGLPAYLKGKTDELAFMAWAWNAGIRPGKELVLRELRKEAAFFDPVTNRFSEDAYKSKLAEVNLTPALVEQQARDYYARVHYVTAMESGVRMPRIYGSIVANQTKQSRDGRWFTLTPAMAGVAPRPTDDQLRAFMAEHAAQWRTPELRSGVLITFDNPADANVAIGEDKIQARFDFRKDALSVPERRTFTVLSAPDRATADRIAAALRAGQTPAAVGQANNLQPAQYDATPRSAVSDPAVAGAVFGLAANEVSAPVQARVGFIVAKVTAIQPGREVTLADVRDQIVQELRGQEARAAISRRVEAYEAARREGKSVDEAVSASGARVTPFQPVTRDGRNSQGQQVSAPQPLLEAIWKLAEGRASEVTGAGAGEYFVVRVDDIAPAAMPSVDAVRERVTAAWTAQENARLLTARADALTARLRAGEDIAAVAASAGAPLVTGTGVTRDEAGAARYGQGAVLGLFGAERNQPFSQPGETGLVIGRVDRISPPTAALAADEALRWRAQLAQTSTQALFQSTVDAATRRAKASYDEARAREALGVAPAEAAPAQPARR